MITRRKILSVLGSVPLVGLACRRPSPVETARHLNHRVLGRTGRWVVPFALGGQASIQWTREGIDPADIIVRAVEQGVNYLDTANAYGPSQQNYGEAFRRLRLVPGQPDYDAALRERLFLATKTTRRFARDPAGEGPTAIDDVKRSLTQIFGDGEGYIPEGAYLDSIQVHNLTRMDQVEQVYEGLETRGRGRQERIGALAGLLDYRDGTNYTGLNPEGRKWIRHIGITGHLSSPVLMNALQRDTGNYIDTLLVALNPNDRAYSSHQYNVIPLAQARGLGVIAMKLFADGVFYGKEPKFSRTPEDVILSVGAPNAIDPEDLVRYPLSVPGVSCAIVGIGHIDRVRAENDQMLVNLTAAMEDVATADRMRAIEQRLAELHGTETNYFQERSGLVQPSGVSGRRVGERFVVEWHTAFAGPDPVRSYNVYAGDKLLASVPFRPQTTLEPLRLQVPAGEVTSERVRVEAVV